jgi:hypothetical protein
MFSVLPYEKKFRNIKNIPDDNIKSVQDLIFYLRKINKDKRTINLVIPGNAGQPGGGRGGKIYIVTKKWLIQKFENGKNKLKLFYKAKGLNLDDTKVKLIFNKKLEMFKTILLKFVDCYFKYINVGKYELITQMTKCMENDSKNQKLKLKFEYEVTEFKKYLDAELNPRYHPMNNLPLEEQMMDAWLNHIKDNRDKKKEYQKISNKWGIYRYADNDCFDEKQSSRQLQLHPVTIQQINYKSNYNYTDISEDKNIYALNKYGICYAVNDVELNFKAFQYIVNLLFTFAPNYNDNFPSGKATLEPFDPYSDYGKLCLKACISAILKTVEKNSILILPHLGSGVNLGEFKKNPPEFHLKFLEFIDGIIESDDDIKKKELTIYVFQRKF